MNDEKLNRDTALLELLVRRYGAETIKKEIQKNIKFKKTINNGNDRK